MAITRRKLIDRNWLLAAVASAALVLSCATPYQTQSWLNLTGGGFKEKRINDSAFLIEFVANGFTSKDRIFYYMLYRCAELTVQNGYDLFMLSSRAPSTKTSSRGADLMPAVLHSGQRSGHLIKVRGGGGAPVMIYGGSQAVWSATDAVVLMFHNPLPDSVLFSLDARTVLADLADYVKSGGSHHPPAQDEVLHHAFVAHARVDFGMPQMFDASTATSGGRARPIADVMHTIDLGRLSLYNAFQDHVRREADTVGGSLVVTLSIDANGLVTDCRVVSSTISDQTFVEQVRSSLQRATFGAADVMPMTISALQIAFTPATASVAQTRHSAEHAIIDERPAPPMPQPKPAPSVQSVPASAPMQKSPASRALVNAPLRAKPGTSSEVRVMLAAGTPIVLVSKLENDTGTWWYVSADDRSGWLRADEIDAASR